MKNSAIRDTPNVFICFIFIRFYDIMELWETDTNHDRE